MSSPVTTLLERASLAVHVPDVHPFLSGAATTDTALALRGRRP